MPNQTIQKEVNSKVNYKKEYLCLRGVKVKEEDNEITVTGLIATTHLDRVGDMLSVDALKQMVGCINDTSTVAMNQGAVRSVSLHHDWITEKDSTLDEVGFLKPTARLVELDNGHAGVEVDATLNAYYKNDDTTIAEVKYRIDHGSIGGFSIEYDTDDEHCKEIEHDGEKVRFIEELTDFAGVGLARSRMIANPQATFVYKEIVDKIKSMEENKMTEKEKVKTVLKKEEEPVVEAPKVEETPKEEEKGEEEVTEQKEVKIKEEVIKTLVKEMKESEDYQKVIKEAKIPDKKMIKDGDDEMTLSIKEMNKAIKEGDVLTFKEIIEREDLINKGLGDPSNYRTNLPSTVKVKCVGKGLKIVGGIQAKGTLGYDTNSSAFTQQPVEFADLFAPGIVDTFNNRTDLWGYLRKEQAPQSPYYQWKMITNRNSESNATFVDRDDTSVLKNFASKENYQTPIKLARRGISVTDFTLRYSAPSLGDLFALEVEAQMNHMMTTVDEALFAEVQDGDGNSPLGLEAVADSIGNTTLYGKIRSTSNRLSPDAAAVKFTYSAISASITEAMVRSLLDNMETEGTRKQNMAIITSPAGRSNFLNLFDDNRRFATTEATFGFNKTSVATYDGIPIITDPFCKSTATASADEAMYIIDTNEDIIVIGMEPRVISLAKVGAGTEAYLEMHFAHVYKQPRRIAMLDSVTGP